ncbi:putative histone kinase SNF1 [Besnoitia besnoiti]|uniref:Putative histone kinase SNF1 n=1 Tax=Besnoitia besnoiti TaxID=94643 RepID=A0A2A9M452_BESBE|nr:putative histone kinase SNF1 [Besnoitia besnoiti]PFH32004.1 putative histone kinase SNF1 [Besnoitia besnoiti]
MFWHQQRLKRVVHGRPTPEEPLSACCPVSTPQSPLVPVSSNAAGHFAQNPRASLARSCTSSAPQTSLSVGGVPSSLLHQAVSCDATAVGVGTRLVTPPLRNGTIPPSPAHVWNLARGSLQDTEEKSTTTGRACTSRCNSGRVSCATTPARHETPAVIGGHGTQAELRYQSPRPGAYSARAPSPSPDHRVACAGLGMPARLCVPSRLLPRGYTGAAHASQENAGDFHSLFSQPRIQEDVLALLHAQGTPSSRLASLHSLAPLCTARYRPSTSPYSQDGSQTDRPRSVAVPLGALATPPPRHAQASVSARCPPAGGNAAACERTVGLLTGVLHSAAAGPDQAVGLRDGPFSRRPCPPAGCTFALAAQLEAGEREAWLSFTSSPQGPLAGSFGPARESTEPPGRRLDVESTCPPSSAGVASSNFVGSSPPASRFSAPHQPRREGAVSFQGSLSPFLACSTGHCPPPFDASSSVGSRVRPRAGDGRAVEVLNSAAGSVHLPSLPLSFSASAADCAAPPPGPPSSEARSSMTSRLLPTAAAGSSLAGQGARKLDGGAQLRIAVSPIRSARLAKGGSVIRDHPLLSYRQTHAGPEDLSALHTRAARMPAAARNLGGSEPRGSRVRPADPSRMRAPPSEWRLSQTSAGGAPREAKRNMGRSAAQIASAAPVKGSETDRSACRKKGAATTGSSGAGRAETLSHSSGALTSRQSEEVGKRSMGQYTLGETIGEGTFGKVKLGVHVATQEQVAIKILEKSRIKEADDVERVVREIHILQTVKHPHVVRLFEIIETQQHLYLIMEYASGGELYDYIVNRQRVEEMEACKFFRQILSGVEQIHVLKICHRDLKPENILLDADLNIKIVDFGLSNTYTGRSTLKTACGSPSYAAPEMIEGKDYEPLAVDVWSCGVILFALLAGYLPFEDRSTDGLYRKIIKGDFECPEWVSDLAQDLLRRLLETDPTKRLRPECIKRHPWYNLVTESGDVSFSIGGSTSLPSSFAPGEKQSIAGSSREGAQARLAPLAATPVAASGCGVPFCGSCAQWINEIDPEAPLAASILCHMVRMGLDARKAVESLRKGERTSLTAAYFLLLAKASRGSGRASLLNTGATGNMANAEPVAAPLDRALPIPCLPRAGASRKARRAAVAPPEASANSAISAHSAAAACFPASFCLSASPRGTAAARNVAAVSQHSRVSEAAPSLAKAPADAAVLSDLRPRVCCEPAGGEARQTETATSALPPPAPPACRVPAVGFEGLGVDTRSGREEKETGRAAGETETAAPVATELARAYVNQQDAAKLHAGGGDVKPSGLTERGLTEDEYGFLDSRQRSSMSDSTVASSSAGVPLTIVSKKGLGASERQGFAAPSAGVSTSSSGSRPAAASKASSRGHSARPAGSSVGPPSSVPRCATLRRPAVGSPPSLAETGLVSAGRPAQTSARLGPPRASANRARLHKLRLGEKTIPMLPLSARGCATYRAPCSARPRLAAEVGSAAEPAGRTRAPAPLSGSKALSAGAAARPTGAPSALPRVPLTARGGLAPARDAGGSTRGAAAGAVMSRRLGAARSGATALDLPQERGKESGKTGTLVATQEGGASADESESQGSAKRSLPETEATEVGRSARVPARPLGVPTRRALTARGRLASSAVTTGLTRARAGLGERLADGRSGLSTARGAAPGKAGGLETARGEIKGRPSPASPVETGVGRPVSQRSVVARPLTARGGSVSAVPRPAKQTGETLSTPIETTRIPPARLGSLTSRLCGSISFRRTSPESALPAREGASIARPTRASALRAVDSSLISKVSSTARAARRQTVVSEALPPACPESGNVRLRVPLGSRVEASARGKDSELAKEEEPAACPRSVANTRDRAEAEIFEEGRRLQCESALKKAVSACERSEDGSEAFAGWVSQGDSGLRDLRSSKADGFTSTRDCAGADYILSENQGSHPPCGGLAISNVEHAGDAPFPGLSGDYASGFEPVHNLELSSAPPDGSYSSSIKRYPLRPSEHGPAARAGPQASFCDGARLLAKPAAFDSSSLLSMPNRLLPGDTCANQVASPLTVFHPLKTLQPSRSRTTPFPATSVHV